MNSDLFIGSIGLAVVLIVGVGVFFLLVEHFYEKSPVHPEGPERDNPPPG